MNFFRTKTLVADLKENRIFETEKALYYVASTGLLFLLVWILKLDPTPLRTWDHVEYLIMFLYAACGT